MSPAQRRSRGSVVGVLHWTWALRLYGAALTGLAMAPAVFGVCDGCPPLAWKVELQLTNGRSVRGQIPIHPERMREVLSFEGGEATPSVHWWGIQPWPGSPLGCVEVWQDWEYVDRSPLTGFAIRDGQATPATFRLPRAVVLVGDPICVAVSEVARIVDDSVDGPGFRDSGAALRIRTEAAPLLVRDPTLAVRTVVPGDHELFCLAYDSHITLADLMTRCRFDNIADEGILVLFYDGGT